MLKDYVDHQGDIGGGTSHNVPPFNERCEALHAPSGPSSLAQINLVGGLGDCDALQAPPSGKNSTNWSNILTAKQ